MDGKMTKRPFTAKGHSVRIKPLKVRHYVTKSNLIVLFLSFLCINIDLSIRFIFLTLYMT